MRALLLVVLIAGAGCHYIAPFDPEDQPIDPQYDAEDTVADGSAGDGEACAPDCDGVACGPDGCGGVCPSHCQPSEICALGCDPLFDEDCTDDRFDCLLPARRLWVYIPTDDSFTMGSPTRELGHEDDEPQHEVTLTEDFLMLSTEVDQATVLLYLSGRNPSHFSPGDGGDCTAACPAEHLRWFEAATLANNLSTEAGLPTCYTCQDEATVCALSERYDTPQQCPGYRLPTEAEWEYAARAGTTTATFKGDLDAEATGCESSPVLAPIAWYCGTAGSTRPAGELESNDWGLFDMLGNVAEWCQDFYVPEIDDEITIDPFGPREGTERVVRGGSWETPLEQVRAATREGVRPDRRDFIGARLVRTVR